MKSLHRRVLHSHPHDSKRQRIGSQALATASVELLKSMSHVLTLYCTSRACTPMVKYNRSAAEASDRTEEHANRVARMIESPIP